MAGGHCMSSLRAAIVGSGLIGRSWAVVRRTLSSYERTSADRVRAQLFSKAGYKVTLFDIADSQLDVAMVEIRRTLGLLQSMDMLNGRTTEEVMGRISVSKDLGTAVAGACHVQVRAQRFLGTSVLNGRSVAGMCARECGAQAQGVRAAR